MFLQLFFTLFIVNQISPSPLLYSAPQVLSLVSSASSASSGPQSNIANLRKNANLEDDDFFKDSLENQQVDISEAPPSLLSLKLNKLVQKFRFLTTLTNGGTADNNDDDFQKAQDDFDKEFDEDFNKDDLKDASGYTYDKPMKLQKQVVEDSNKISPSSIGVFFTELIGSVVGLIYGAAAQLQNQATSTTPSSE